MTGALLITRPCESFNLRNTPEFRELCPGKDKPICVMVFGKIVAINSLFLSSFGVGAHDSSSQLLLQVVVQVLAMTRPVAVLIIMFFEH